jgi:6-phosphogluconolactonase (cycloisomerase 2 family)
MKRNLFKIFLAPLGLVVLSAALWAGDTAISDGQNAEDVIGQTTSGAPDFNSGTLYDSQSLLGLNVTYDVAVDTVSHRLFVADTNTHRVLVYDLNSSNVIVDRTPDYVLGQSNFLTNNMVNTINSLFSPTSVDFDSAGNQLFVAGIGNERVLMFDTVSITNGENAVNVLGQANFNSSSPATTINGLRDPYYSVYAGSRLFVSDTGNHRVVVYDLTSITDGENAVNVLGQGDFTSGSSGTAANRLYNPRDLCIDKAANRLYVADITNQRVVVFDIASITDGENAVNVLGQTNFTASTSGTTQNKFNTPYGLAFSPLTQRLFVAENGNNRITVFDVSAVTDGENAINVLGQSNYTASSPRTTRDGLFQTLGLGLDDGANRLYSADYRNYRVVQFDVSTTTIANGQNAENVVGQTDSGGNPDYTTADIYDGIATDGYFWPTEIAIDTTTHRLFVSDFGSNRVLVYDLDGSNSLANKSSDYVLGQPTMAMARSATTINTLNYPFGLAYDSNQNRLFVADQNNNRIVVFDVASITDGENAVNVLGRNTFTSSSAGTTQSMLNTPRGLAYDQGSSLLYAGDYTNHRVMVFNVASITDGENAVNVLGQADFTSGSSVGAQAQNRLYAPSNVALNGSGLLAVADTYNHRVLFFDVTSITDGENAVNVLGQTTFTTNASATTQSGMSYPRDIEFDAPGNRLFVCDEINDRITVFDVATITNGENAANVLGQSNFTSGSNATSQSRLYSPYGIANDRGMNRLYIADYYNNRVILQSVGPVSPSVSTLSAGTGNGAGKIDLSWASAGDDGDYNNLTGYYRIQYATYTATWSTSTTPTNAYTSTITATNVSPGVVQSTTIVVSPTIPQTWYFVLWTADEAGNWSTVSSAVTGVPPYVPPTFGVGFDVPGNNGGLSQGGTAWGDFDSDGDLDVLAGGNDGTNSQVRVYKSNGNGTFTSTAVNVAAANSGLKDGDVAWGDFDSDGDLDVLANGSDGSNRQLRVYKNNGNATFNTTAVEVPGSANVGLSTGAVTCGDFDNDGDLDVLAGGYDGTNNQLRVYKNNGNATFDGTAINVAGSNNGLRAGGVAWGDFDNDADLDVLISGTDGTNRQLRVYANNGNGTFNATATNVAGSNNGLSDGRVAWGDFDKDGDLEVLVSGTDGTNHQLRTYSNNGNGTFNATATNVAGSNGGLTNSAVAVGDYNVDGNIDVLAAGRTGLVGYWKLDENTGTSAADSSGNGYTGTLTNGAGWGDGYYGKGMTNDGSDDYLNVPTFSQPTSAMTIVLWIKTVGTLDSYDSLAGNSNSSWNAGWGLFYDGISMKFWIQDYAANVAASSWVSGAGWRHVAGTWDGSTIRVYLEGVEGTSDSYSGALTDSSALRIGDTVESANRNYPGVYDEVRIYNRALSAGEIKALYQATRPTGGALRLHKGVGDGTFNATPLEVDNGLVRGGAAWGDADGDGDLDILTSGSDGTNSQLSVYLSTQSLTASNTLPTAPSTLAGTMGFNATGVSVASFTWAAGSDSGTGSTAENGLTYDLQISTTSNYSVLMSPGQIGASPRMGSYLKPPKIFNSNTYYGVVLKSTDPWNAQTTASYGLRTDTTYYYRVKTVDAGLGESSWSSNGTMYSAAPPSTSTLISTAGAGQVTIGWNSAGDDGMNGNLTGTYRIQYATYTATWSASSTPTNATTVTISTTNVVPGSAQSKTIAGLTSGLTYYFVLWTGDEVPNWSDISNTTSAYVATDFQWFDDVQIEVDGAGNGLKWGTVAWGDFDNDGAPDILVNGETGSTRELRIYKSNGNGTMDATQIEVDGAGNGLRYGSVSWGDFDNDGDLDIGALGWLGGTRQLRVYTNNGNGTINATQLEVDGGGGGMADGHFMWGDYDNDGDIDILAAGVPGGGNSELRIYKNNGNATTDRSQIEVDGVNGGVQLCGVAWGDYDTDGDLDILALGATAAGGRELRIYKNNGNGTMDPAQIEVDGSGNGLQDGGVAWGDFDSDGDMDIAAVGYTGSTRELRIYKNNGNGTMDPAQIEVDGSGNGLRYSTVAWGDFDVDGDLDLLTSGQQTSGTSRELRVYKNNGNATMDATQIEVDGAGNGLQEGGVAWGDFDVDGDLDILASGEQTSGTTRELRIYKNQSATSNTAPTAPGTLTGTWAYNATGISTATFKWVAGSDTGTGSTAANALTYAVEVSSVSGFTGKSVATGLWSSPGMGNYLKPPKIFDGNTTHGLMLRYLPQTNTTYYFRVKTVDAGLKESAWSVTGSVYTLVASSAPSVVTDLAANAAVTDGQMSLTWTAPTNVNSAANAAYDVRYSTVGAITNDTEFNNATALTGEPTPGSAGMSQSMTVTGLVPLSTCYFAIKTSNDNGTSGVDVTSPRASAVAHAFDATQIEVETLNGGPGDGSAVWGDFDNDGDLDILMSGTVSGSRELRIYKNNANGTISATQVEVDGAGNGLTYSRAIWGDYDNDGDLDILAMGYNGSTRELRIYKNNGNATMDAAQIEVDGSGNGLQEGAVAWGDYDNDGDLDILISGYTGSTRELRIYKNNGNATIDAAQIEVDGSGNGLRYSGVAWGDYDNDGDLDILTTGQQTTGTTKELRIYKNNGNATIDPAQIEVDGAGNGMEGSVAWGDYDNDGDLDILVVGYTGGSTRELRIYKNNANGTINATQIDGDGSNGGLNLGVAEWGDFDNDGDLDILTHGSNVGYSQLRVYQNNGNATIDAAQIEVDGLNGGLENGEAHWGDYDTDGDLDVLIAGSSNLRVYKNKHDLKQTNTTPTAPTTLAAGFTFDASGVSVASLTWNAGTDSGTGATPENVLTYDIQISTVSNFASVIFPGQMGASPRMGSYLKPPKIFNSNTYYGVTMKSADPWNAQTTASYGLRTDTTYYYRVKTVDSALAESGWSSNGSAYTGVVPSTSTLAAASTATDGEVLLTWNSAGDDGMNGNVTGTYRIQYATYTPTWSTSSTPTNATTVTIATATQVPGSAQSKLITGLTGGLTYYFVLWTGDEVPNWSTISNSTSAVAALTVDVVSPSTSTLAATSGNPEEVALTWSSAGDDGSTGNLTGNYRIQYATYSATWDTSSTPANATTVTIATTTQTPGSAQGKTITGLTSGTTYYFAIYTQDEANTWSSVSNTTSAVAGLWFNPTQIEVDGANGGMNRGGVCWGDFDSDGDLDILASGYTGSSRELRVYKNNGNGTVNGTQIEVDGAGAGLYYSSVGWGDFDNDGDLDILVSGLAGGSAELRIYKNNGNGTIDASQIEPGGATGGLYYGGVGWGDFDNDGDLDILASGFTGANTRELWVYKNNGNGTVNGMQIEVEGATGGLSYSSVAWGDFDSDGDLDVLTNGQTSGATREIRVYKNNGNGTIDPIQIEVDGSANGLRYSSVAWGDYDNDGDMDILASGELTSGLTRELRVYKNNGNGTIDATQIEVDGGGGGLDNGSVGWGDFDNDGDLDILAVGRITSGNSRQLRAYKNNGNGTINATQIEVDGAGGGLWESSAVWGDFDNDGDLDILAGGQQTTGNTRELRIYKSNASLSTANTAPSAPVTLTGDWAHNAAGISTATFKWNAGADNGSGATAVNVLTYHLEVSTTSGFTGKSIVAGQWTSPGMGNYLKPPKVFDGNTNHGVMLHYLTVNSTFYYRVKSIDAGLKESPWSTTGSIYTLVASSEPSTVMDLVAGGGDGQIVMSWTAPLNIQSGGGSYYDLRYSTVGAITDNTAFSNATQITGEPTPGPAGASERMVLTGLTPGVMHYFGIKSANANGTSALDGSSPRGSYVANYFDMTQTEVDGAGGGMYSGGVSWGDFDNDGDLDILESGALGSEFALRVFRNNGNGTLNSTEIVVAAWGFGDSDVSWGDFDNDGDLDILTSGNGDSSGQTPEILVYKNNGNGTINLTEIRVETDTFGLMFGGVAWGDFDNDGDLDILANGYTGLGESTHELRIYKNNGNGTLNKTQMEVDGPANGLSNGRVAWGDFDKDSDLDILVIGSHQLWVFKNNGNGTIDAAQIEVDGAGGGLNRGSVGWGDFDNDGDLDILASGQQVAGSTRELRVYKNNGNGTIDAAQIEVDGAGGGMYYSSVGWGDLDNDGDLDILASGQQTTGSTHELRVYKNNGNGTIDAAQIEVDGAGGGVYYGSVGWGDYDNDGDLDILSNGQTNRLSSELRIAPATLTGGFSFNASAVSVASMTWNAGTDSGTGATPENVLTYDLQISTVSNFNSVIFPGQMGASPRMGSYLKPPKIFNSNTYYGVVLKSTDPWNAQATTSYGLRTDTTYYYRVKTVDSALEESSWSSGGSAYSGVSPSTSTLAAAAGTSQASLAT